MSGKEYSVYLNDLPRHGLGIVFLWFGIDKFIIHDFYLSWFSATARVRIFLPFQDLSSSIYAIGALEVIFAALLFAGLKIRWVSFAVGLFITVTLLTAQYPSSYPQDIGLLGIAAVLFLTNVTWKKAETEQFLKFLWVIRFSLAVVLFLWAADQMVNFDRHIGWFQLSSPIGGFLAVNELDSFLSSIFIVEIVLAGLIVTGNVTITKYSLIAVTIFFISAWLVLEPPLNNHQTIGLAIATAWLACIAYNKKKV